MSLDFLSSRQFVQYTVQIHRGVPHFNEKILKSVERTLKRFGPHESFERTSWTMVDDRNLFWRKFFCIIFAFIPTQNTAPYR